MNLKRITKKDQLNLKKLYFDSILSIDEKIYTKNQKRVWASQAWDNKIFDQTINEGQGWLINKKDEIDYLWIGTENGLVRIDLNTRKVINIYQTSNNHNSIVSNNIKDIDWNNAEKELWLATDRGLSRFVLENEQFFNIQTTPYADGIIENNISEILYATKSERLWLQLKITLE